MLQATVAGAMWGQVDSQRKGHPMATENESRVQALRQQNTLGAAQQPSRSAPSGGALAMPPGRGLTKTASIGESLRFEGTLSGLEDVVVDGEVEGAIRLQQSSLTVGPSGRISADIEARNVTVLGHVTGNIVCLDRMRLCSTGSIDGDVKAPRILIEDGAVVRGNIDVAKTQAASEAEPQTRSPSPSTQAGSPADS